jgi:hypothetical protein
MRPHVFVVLPALDDRDDDSFVGLSVGFVALGR